jgi:hypothetical protein
MMPQEHLLTEQTVDQVVDKRSQQALAAMEFMAKAMPVVAELDMVMVEVELDKQ